jgi:hypothetical protein
MPYNPAADGARAARHDARRAMTAQIDALLDRTRDAYSFDTYGESGWRGAIAMLVRRGYDDRQIEAILRSKWTRWAGDMSNKPHGRNNGADLARFLDTAKGTTAKDVDELVIGTFGALHDDKTLTGADLAGHCEGEQIAALIDLARATVRAAETRPGLSTALADLGKSARAILNEIKARRS